MTRVAVIGGGIAGLSAAYYLQSEAAGIRVPVDITLLERDSRLGGKILTEKTDGFVIEGGPDAMVSTKPWGIELCREVGLEGQLVGATTEQRTVYVLHRGRLVPLPEGLMMMVPAGVWPMLKTPLLTPAAKLRLGLDLILPARSNGDDEALGAFVSRRLGRQAYEHLIEPLMSGIYAGDGDRLSLKATFPQLQAWERDHGSLVRAAMSLRRQRHTASSNGRPRSMFVTPQAGLGEIVRSLLAQLGHVDIKTETGVRKIQSNAGGYHVTLDTGDTLQAEAVIIATPAYTAARILADEAPELSDALGQIEYVSTATVSLAFPASALPTPLAGHGYVVPRVEKAQVLACTWTSSKFPHRAPRDHVLLRVFIGRSGDSEEILEDERELARIAREELRRTLGISAEPSLSRVFCWPKAMPQYNLGHLDRLRAIKQMAAGRPGLALAGAAYGGIGVPDCIHSGQEAAKQVCDHVLRHHVSGPKVQALGKQA